MLIEQRLLVFLLIFLATKSATSFDAVDIAAMQVDANPKKTYVMGGNGPDNFDCSGLTWYSFGYFGIELPLQAISQSTMNQGDEIIKPRVSELKRGDLLFFETDPGLPGIVTHVGIYEGNNMMLNAVSTEYGLRRSDITSSYWSPRILSARRLPLITGIPSSKFVVGDELAITENTVTLRRLRQQYPIGVRNTGDLGKVIFGPVRQSVNNTSHWWWHVDFNSGPDGWVAEQYLKQSGTASPVPTAIVTNTVDGTVSIIDTQLMKVVDTVPVGFAPIDAVFTPDGSLAFIFHNTNLISTIEVATRKTASFLATLYAHDIALNPNGKILYVSTGPSYSPKNTLVAVDVASRKTLNQVQIPTDNFLSSLAVSSDGRRAYVGRTDGMSVVDTSSFTEIKRIPMPNGGAGDIAISPDGARVYARTTVTIEVINAVTNMWLMSIPIQQDGGSSGVVLTPDGEYLYTGIFTQGSGNAVAIVHTATNAIDKTIPLSAAPTDLAMRPNGAFVYATKSDGTVSIIATSTNTSIRTITVGKNPQGIGITPW